MTYLDSLKRKLLLALFVGVHWHTPKLYATQAPQERTEPAPKVSREINSQVEAKKNKIFNKKPPLQITKRKKEKKDTSSSKKKVFIVLFTALAAATYYYKDTILDFFDDDDDIFDFTQIEDEDIPKFTKIKAKIIEEEGEVRLALKASPKGFQLYDDKVLEHLNYYIKLREKSNIQVDFNSEAVGMLHYKGSLVTAFKITLLKGSKQLIKDPSHRSKLKLKILTGKHRKITQTFKISIDMEDVIDKLTTKDQCDQCIQLVDIHDKSIEATEGPVNYLTIKEEIEGHDTLNDKNREFHYAWSTCCQNGKSGKDKKIIHHYYTKEEIDGLGTNPTCIYSGHDLKYELHTLDLIKAKEKLETMGAFTT